MMKRTMHGGLRFTATLVGLATGLVLCASQALAQQPYPQQYPQQQPAYPAQQPAYPAQQPAYPQQPQAAYQAQVAPQMPAAAAKADDTDQGKVVGHLGLGYLGQITLGAGSGGMTSGPAFTAPVQVVGIRYWLGPALGLDLGLGFGTQGGSSTNATGMSVDDASTLGFVLHGGLPLVLGNTQHLSVQLIPEINFGYASVSQQVVVAGMGSIDTPSTGILINVGARVGGELFFGFIGVPSLSLEASAGLFLTSQSYKTDVNGVSTKGSQLNISTQVFANPWDIFQKSIAARYYF